jgi:hypothetical protein
MDGVDVVQPGRYQHYKGAIYRVLFTARDANADVLGMHAEDAGGPRYTRSPHVIPLSTRTVVVYVPVDDPTEAWVRTLRDFVTHVCANEDCDAYGQIVRPETAHDEGRCSSAVRRFTYLGSD